MTKSLPGSPACSERTLGAGMPAREWSHHPHRQPVAMALPRMVVAVRPMSRIWSTASRTAMAICSPMSMLMPEALVRKAKTNVSDYVPWDVTADSGTFKIDQI